MPIQIEDKAENEIRRNLEVLSELYLSKYYGTSNKDTQMRFLFNRSYSEILANLTYIVKHIKE